MRLNESEYFEIDVDIEGTLIKGSGPVFSEVMGQWYPGDGPDIKDFRVTWRGLDITDKLTHKERKQLEDRLLVDLNNEDMHE